ncbi:MAG: DUF2294 domain-containing protein [Cyanobacteria bacterium P01_H01_bin.162]
MSSATTRNITRGQAQRTLSQKIQKLYKNQIGHSTGKVTCQIIDNTVVVIAEDALTKLEQLLIEGEKDESTPVQVDVEQVRSDLDTAIRPLFVDVIQEILSIEVVDVLSDTTLETGRTAIVAVLAETPELR